MHCHDANDMILSIVLQVWFTIPLVSATCVQFPRLWLDSTQGQGMTCALQILQVVLHTRQHQVELAHKK